MTTPARRVAVLLLALVLTTTGLSTTAPAQSGSGFETRAETVDSFDGTPIDINVCRPATASTDDPVPVILHSHGWGGTKRDCKTFQNFLSNGFGVVSMTQRGNGDSGGQNHVMDPEHEGRDIVAVVDHIAAKPWVETEDEDPTDPVLGSIGGSYGGGFQWVGAFTDALLNGESRFDAMSPGNTWHDLAQSLAPNGVVRSEIVAGLYVAGNQNNDLAPFVHGAFATTTATNRLVDGPDPVDYRSEFHQHGASWFEEDGMKLDVPARITQGAADILFNLNQGWHNYQQALTDEAREESLFLGTQSGHGLPGVFPQGDPVPFTPRTGTACQAPNALTFFQHHLQDGTETEDVDEESVRLTSVDGTCISLDTLPDADTRPVLKLEGQVLPVGPRGTATFTPVFEGPTTLAGIPQLEVTATTHHPDARLFWGLAVGQNTSEAQLVDAQWMPTRFEGPAIEQTISTELGGIADEVDTDETVYLVVSPYAAQFNAHPSRVPGTVVLEDVDLGLPLVD